MSFSVAALLIYGFVAFVVIAALKRLGDVRTLPFWIKPAMVLFGVVPIAVGAMLLNPGPPSAVSRLARVHDKDDIVVPDGSCLLVAGVLSDLDAMDDKKMSQAGKTNYTLTVTGDGWNENLSGEIRRKTGHTASGSEAGGTGVKDQSRARSAALGEDLEERFDVKAPGTLHVEITNWQGAAADAVLVQVVPAPPKKVILWTITVIAGILGMIAEIRYKAVQIAGDMVFLAAFAVFMPDKVTPASGFQEAGAAAFGAALLGWLGVGGVCWLILKYLEQRANKAEAG